MSIKQKIGGAVATAVMMVSVFAPSAFAATSVTVSDNGVFSHNGAAVVNLSSSKVKQKNTTVVNTFVGSGTNTGGNHASFNTGGGSNTITTGDSTTAASVTVAGGSNTNSAADCCCDGKSGDTTVEISGNGAFSHNGVLVVDACKNSVKQSNTTVVNTAVVSLTNTGGNSASFNSGGSQSITTGDSTTGAQVTVTGSSNTN